MAPNVLSAPLLHWFARRKRDLPWRREPRDPYHVWLSEVMLQQTQVATVIPYYERWLRRFPTLADLAAAPLDDVLKQWEGLGYYSRARNFHKAAQTVMREHDGRIPRTVEALMALPGIGRYTAGAIASLAFNIDAPLLDGNVKRVLCRMFGLRAPADDELWHLAESLLPEGNAGAFNEALMELGATVCTPRAPKCSSCPMNAHCKAFARGEPEAYPAKMNRKATPHYDVITAVIVDSNGRVLMGQRPRNGLLGGLWEFVSSEFRASSAEKDGPHRTPTWCSHEARNGASAPRQKAGADAPARADLSTVETAALKRMIAERTGLELKAKDAELLGAVKHGFTHFRITRHAWLVHAKTRGRMSLRPRGYDQLRWAPVSKLEQLALTRSDQHILELYHTHRLSLFAKG